MSICSVDRQVVHSEHTQDMNKAESAKQRLQSINSSLQYQTISTKLTCENALQIIGEYDIVVDATDNFEARYIINDACVLLNKPFVSGSAVGMEGQITVIIPHKTACYRCLYPEPSIAEMCRSCANAGVLGPVPGIIGSMEAVEAMKLILTTESSSKSYLSCLTGRQLLYDASTGECFNFDLPAKRANCKVCGEEATIKSMTDTSTLLTESRKLAEEASMCYMGSVEDSNKISTKDYHEQYFHNVQKLHIVVDVRSKVQFELSSFSIYSEKVKLFESWEEIRRFLETETISNDQIFLLRIPLSELKAKLQSQDESPNNFVEDMKSTCSSFTIENIFVLCRRGIDSTVATRALLAALTSDTTASSLKIRNIEGGLTAWKSEVDANFPMY